MSIDQVRVISNISSGQLGQTLAQALITEGAIVTLLEGPATHPLQSTKIKILKFTYFDELEQLLKKTLIKKFDVVIHAAAVADYQLQKQFKEKLDADKERLTLTLIRTPKLINTIKKQNPRTILVGFKLETGITEKSIKRKTQKLFTDARCNLVVANSFKKDNYQAVLIDDQGKILAKAKTRLQLIQQLINQTKKLL